MDTREEEEGGATLETPHWVVVVFCGGGAWWRSVTFSGKLSLALLPLKRSAAWSYALAAASAVSNVPNHTLAALNGSLISAAHLPHGLCLTPRYFLLGSSSLTLSSLALYSYTALFAISPLSLVVSPVQLFEYSALANISYNPTSIRFVFIIQ